MAFLKQKALFMIFLIVLSSFSIIRITEVGAQQQACCERTLNGDFCKYTDRTQCDSKFKNSLAKCEESSFCELGCCFDSDSGECFKHSTRSECQNKEGTWEKSALCEIQQCEVGCCQLSNQAFISTSTKCKQVTSQYPNVQTKFDPSIKDEFACVNSVRTGDLGCCVSGEGDCKFTTRKECGLEAAQQVDEQGNRIVGANASVGVFHQGVLCSNDRLKCNAAKQQKLGCYNEDVYWFDSEGNPENVFLGSSSEAKARSYNNGLILEDSGCETTPGDKNCGNCDYTKGTLCREKDGEFSCIGLDCKETSKNDNAPDATGGGKDLGESWCIYDGPVGFGTDYVGSRHFKAACINGEEIIEPCRDFREEYCTQSFSNGQATTEFGSIYKILTQNIPQLRTASSPFSNLFGQQSGYSEAACKPNRHDSCAQCNQFSSTADAKACCDELAYRDCFFLEAGVTNKGGTCVPMVPPGLRFWGEEASVLNRVQTGPGQGQGQNQAQNTISKSPSAPGDSVCSVGNVACEVGFSKTTFSDWECTYNCHCLKEETFVAAHAVCRSLGDCGSYFNYQGVFTEGGFDFKVEGPKGEKDIPDKVREKVMAKIRDDLLKDARVKAPKEKVGPKKHGIKDFFRKSAVPLTIIGATGLVGLAGGGVGGFFGGLLLGPQTLLAPITAIQGLGNVGYGAAFQQSLGNTLSPLGKPGGIFLQQATFAKNTILTTAQAEAQGWVAKEGTGYVLSEAGKKLGEKGAIKLAENGGVEVLAEKGVSSTITTATNIGTAISVLNAVAWIWTVYNVIDLLGSKTVKGKVTFICKSWEAPDGGSDCEKCNDGKLPCSEYRCKSLGKACSIVNAGTSNELCVNKLPNDASSPRIVADKEQMRDLKIDEQINKGFTVIERIPAFTPVKLAIRTDEPAQCKFATKPGVKYDEMTFDFGSSLFEFRRNITFSLPSELATDQAIQLTNGGQYTLYVRCKDANGNDNDKDYAIKFGIQKGPDLTIPQIVETSITNGAFIAADIEKIGLDVFVNEPVDCKWDRRDIDYDLMGRQFSCAQGGFNVSIGGSYKCTTELDIEKPVVQNNESTKQNDYYFRCKDRAGNKNIQSSKFTLVSTIPLKIIKKEPSGLLRTGANIELKIETSDGAENGIAICGWSQENVPLSNMPQFSSTGTGMHSQKIPPQPEGDYKFFISCIDKAGNLASDKIEFKIERDTIAPQIIFVTKDTQLGILTITTDEPAQCQYAENDFPFGRGTPMTTTDNLQHQATLGNILIKCRDLSENHNEVGRRIIP